MTTRLSVNLNKVALIRNARGGNAPDIVKFALDCEAFGAQGITVHPRPDERHIRFSDLQPLKEIVSTEFNIEGNPTDHFIAEVLNVKPHQVTLVPDEPSALTSDNGWDTIKHFDFLKDVVTTFQNQGIRVSIFIDPIEDRLSAAQELGTDRIELYTGPYAHDFHQNRDKAVAPFSLAAEYCHKIGLEVNAGHDLNLDNLQFFLRKVKNVKEVSIGHALIGDALYYGIYNTIQMYRRQIDLSRQ